MGVVWILILASSILLTRSRILSGGGLTIPKKKETPKDSPNFLCSNPSCGKTFTNPLKARNMGANNAKTFEACPYCLAEITVGMEDDLIEESKSAVRETKANIRTETVTKEARAALSSSGPKVEGCKRHLGYLSQRSSKEKIPEECIMCDKIVQCMLQAITG